MLLLLPIIIIPFILLRDTKSKVERTFNPSTTCRGQLRVARIEHAVRSIDGRERLFVRVLLASKSKIDISDPVIRIDVLSAAGESIDTFHRTMYGYNVAPAEQSWARVDGELTVAPRAVASVRAQIASADCRPAWK
jgi:hypothetical protein